MTLLNQYTSMLSGAESYVLDEEQAGSDTAAEASAQAKRERRKKGEPVPISKRGPHFKGLVKKVVTLVSTLLVLSASALIDMQE